eukprot:scaffold5103_cov350-Prasinococcus_capsulatus_cf.AAC.6
MHHSAAQRSAARTPLCAALRAREGRPSLLRPGRWKPSPLSACVTAQPPARHPDPGLSSLSGGRRTLARSVLPLDQVKSARGPSVYLSRQPPSACAGCRSCRHAYYYFIGLRPRRSACGLFC